MDNQAALQVLINAASLYLNSLDDFARPPTMNHIQNAINVLATALAPKEEEQVNVEEN